MPLYTDESLDLLRSRIDLVDVLSPHVELKKAGAMHKGLCPFHEEKTPSFGVQAGDQHYHCFGCGAHGDAIAFYMTHLKMSFVDAVEALAERFHVTLQKTERERSGPSRSAMKEALELATRFYHTCLLHTEEGHVALAYLFERGISLDFIKAFRVGFAPSKRDSFRTLARAEKIRDEILIASGLLTDKHLDFFSDRITFPITDPLGAVVAFSARKIKADTYGGKYINTPETPLFKKSHILFGLSYCRKRMTQEKRAIIVEGQIDALRLIHEGLNLAVAPQGTAFGDGHVKLLDDLGVRSVTLAMDGDAAGRTAAVKIGHFFQKKGISVSVLSLPMGSDPDAFVKANGIQAFESLPTNDYLTFLIEDESSRLDLSDPAQKTDLINRLTERIRSWEDPVMVHESLRKLSKLTGVPESAVGVGVNPFSGVRRYGFVGKHEVDPDTILETDLLRWLLLHSDGRLREIITLNIAPDLFRNSTCQRLFTILTSDNGPKDFLSLGSALETEEEQTILKLIVDKKVNPKKAEEGTIDAIHRLLIRKWMEEREVITSKIQSATCTDEETLQLAKAFDEIKKNQPTVVMP